MTDIEDLKNRIEAIELKSQGKCPECMQIVKGWKPIFGSFAPEWWATMRENGIDPATGHLISCKQLK